MYQVLSDHAANSLENNSTNRPTFSTECQVSRLQSIFVRHVIAGPCFRDPIAPEELTMQHDRAVPSVLVPQFHDEALQTHLFSRSSLANPPLREQRNESFETRKWTKGEQQFLCVPCNPSITKYLRIYGQDVDPSRSLSTNDLQSIHDDVLTNLRPRCPSITKSLNQRLAIHPSRSTTKFSASRGIQTLATGGFKIASPRSSITRSNRGQHKTKIEEVGPRRV